MTTDWPKAGRGAWRIVLGLVGLYAFLRQVDSGHGDPYLIPASLALMTLPIAGIADALFRMWDRGKDDRS